MLMVNWCERPNVCLIIYISFNSHTTLYIAEWGTLCIGIRACITTIQHNCQYIIVSVEYCEQVLRMLARRWYRIVESLSMREHWTRNNNHQTHLYWVTPPAAIEIIWLLTRSLFHSVVVRCYYKWSFRLQTLITLRYMEVVNYTL